MHKTPAWIAVVVAAALLSACGARDAAEAPAGHAAQTAPVADAVSPEGLVVTADGTEFAPPIAPELLPEGVWYCDMGTVHYARAAEGDGRCPLCGMYLTQLDAEPPAQDEGHTTQGHEG